MVYRDGEFLKASYDANIVVLSFMVSLIAAYISISLCEQYRIALTMESLIQDPRKKIVLLLLMGITLGGAGIWCMHFIGQDCFENIIDGVFLRSLITL